MVDASTAFVALNLLAIGTPARTVAGVCATSESSIQRIQRHAAQHSGAARVPHKGKGKRHDRRWHFGGALGQSNLARLDRLVGSMDASSTLDEIYAAYVATCPLPVPKPSTVAEALRKLEYTTKRLSAYAPDRNDLRCRAWYQHSQPARAARARAQGGRATALPRAVRPPAHADRGRLPSDEAARRRMSSCAVCLGLSAALGGPVRTLPGTPEFYASSLAMPFAGGCARTASSSATCRPTGGSGSRRGASRTRRHIRPSQRQGSETRFWLLCVTRASVCQSGLKIYRGRLNIHKSR